VQLEDCALQLYKHNGTQYEYSSYLDLETTLAEQSEELDGFSDKYAHLIKLLYNSCFCSVLSRYVVLVLFCFI